MTWCWQAANPRPHAIFDVFTVFHVFKSLIEGFRSWEYRIRYQLDLLYNLNCSNPKKVNFRRKSYLLPESRPAGAFRAKYLINCESKVACKFLKKKSQSVLNHVLILQKDRTQRMLQIPLKIIDLQNDFNILVAKQWNIRISVPMSYIWLVYWYYTILY